MGAPIIPDGFERVDILGVDPGSTTGFAHLVSWRPSNPDDRPAWRPQHLPAFQSAGEWQNRHQMWAWLSDWEAWEVGLEARVPLLVGAELFIAGANQRHGRGQRSIQDPLAILQALQERLDVMIRRGREVYAVRRSASTVKRWATNERLQRAYPFSYQEEVHGPHARDALRHSLYAAVTVGYSADPMIFRY